MFDATGCEECSERDVPFVIQDELVIGSVICGLGRRASRMIEGW